MGVLELGDRAAVPVAHRRGRIEQQVAAEVGLFLVLLDVELVAFAEDFPVEVAGIDAGGVLAVLGELDGVATVGRAVLAGEEAFDDEPGGKAEVLELGQRGGVDVFGGGFGHWVSGHP